MLQWKSIKHYVFWVYVCSLLSSMQCACAVLYCRLVACTHFSTLSHKRHELKTVIENTMCLYIIYNFCLKHSTFWKVSARYDEKSILVSMVSTRYSRLILMNIEFSRQISKIFKFHDNPSSGSRVVSWGRTDTHDEAMAAFRNIATAPLKTYRHSAILI
jgi:hypothetical protein